jgi:hypothetical protein
MILPEHDAQPTEIEMTNWTWRNEKDLMDRLRVALNEIALAGIPVDVMTFAGFCDSRSELERHVVHCESQARDARVAEFCPGFCPHGVNDDDPCARCDAT